MTTAILVALIIVLVLLGPIFIRPIEQNVELFFLAIGLLTAFFAKQLNRELLQAAVAEPLSFTIAVLVFGAAFRLSRKHLDQFFARLTLLIEPRTTCFGLTIALAALAPIITPVVAALVLVEAIALLRFARSTEIPITVLGCFAIGFGSGLTPLGMPGIAVVLRSLHANFWYLTGLLGPFVAVGVILAAAPILVLPVTLNMGAELPRSKDSWKVVALVRPLKVYSFIAGLVALSGGLRPALDTYLHRVPEAFLFWLNTLSAVVNNSTLAAIEIGPTLNPAQQRAALLGLLISGGILVTGNLPNIVAAARLGIGSREWARVGLYIGIPLLLFCFLVVLWIG